MAFSMAGVRAFVARHETVVNCVLLAQITLRLCTGLFYHSPARRLVEQHGDTRFHSCSKYPNRRYPMAFGLCTGTAPSLDGPIGELKGSWGWWTDGSLRAHGEVLIPATVRNFRRLVFETGEFLLLRSTSVSSVLLDGTTRPLFDALTLVLFVCDSTRLNCKLHSIQAFSSCPHLTLWGNN